MLREEMPTDIPKGYSRGEEFHLHGFYASLALEKAKEAREVNGEDTKFAYVAGVFSTDTRDLDGEILDQDGVSKGLKQYFQKLNSFVDWEHKYGETHDPDFLIGECVKFEPRTLRKKNGDTYRAHWGVFKLFKNKELTGKVLRHLDAGGKLGASVHGLKLAPTSGRGMVDKVMITRISLTPNPVNSETDIRRYDEFMKSLTATKGAAVVPEDLEGDAKTTLHDRVKKIAGNFMEHGMTVKETRKALAAHFGTQLEKGELKMETLKIVTDELNKALAEGEAPKEPNAEEAKTLTLLQKTFGKLGYTLEKANTGKGEGEEDKSDDEENKGEGEAFGKATAYLKSLDRSTLLKMAHHMKMGDKVKGLEKGAMVDSLSKMLDKKGTIKLADEYQKMGKSVDDALAADDAKLLKALEEGTETGDFAALEAELGEGEEAAVVGDTVSYEALTKSINALARQAGKDRERYDEPMAALGKAMVGVMKRQKEADNRFIAFCKAVNLPAFDRTPMLETSDADRRVRKAVAEASGGLAGPVGGNLAGIRHDGSEVIAALTKAVQEKGNALTPSQVALTKNRARKGESLPESIERVLFPTQ